MTGKNQVQVCIDKNSEGVYKINPDFIYNRYDLVLSDYVILKIDDKFVEVKIHQNETELGIWLMGIERGQVESVCKYIFDNYPNIKKIKYQFSYHPIGYYTTKNHFKIYLPDTIEELSSRLSSKGKYNIKREKRLIEEDLGDITIKEYKSSDIPLEVINTYFTFKEKTHHIDYHMSPKEYLENYYVSDVYVMYAGDKIVSMVLSCEQCEVVYIENLTYDTNYSKYSAGQVLYDYYLKRLVEKEKKEIFLAGGNLSYKKRYGSIEETVYHGVIYRHKYSQYFDMAMDCLKNRIKKMLGR